MQDGTSQGFPIGLVRRSAGLNALLALRSFATGDWAAIHFDCALARCGVTVSPITPFPDSAFCAGDDAHFTAGPSAHVTREWRVPV